MKNNYKVCIASSQIEVNDAINFTSTNFFPLPKYLKFVPNDVILLKDNKKIIGTIFLTVCLFRLVINHFTIQHHFGFEAAAFYWHFVDVV